MQEGGLALLLTRNAAEAPLGGSRERVERHLQQSREHASLFDDRIRALQAHRGGGELFAGLFRSGFASLGAICASVAQLATLPRALVRRGGGEERLLENVGVEGAALANKLVILTAVTYALDLSGDEASHTALGPRPRRGTGNLGRAARADARTDVRARARPCAGNSYDFRTAGAGDGIFDRLGPGHASGAQARTRPAAKNGSRSARTPAKKNGAAAVAS